MKTALRLSENRQLAVVMFLDMVSYSARMAFDEHAALSCVSDLESILKEEVPKGGGRLIKFMGDGSMSCFPTATLAVTASLAILERIQERNRKILARDRFQVRIGLHLGDVVFDHKDLFGDAVNVAARVQPHADPGGIAMTGIVYSQVRNKIPLRGLFLAPVHLKNIPGEFPLYSVAPKDSNFFLWKFGKRRKIFQVGLLLLSMILSLGLLGTLSRQKIAERWAFLGVQASNEEGSQREAKLLQEQVEMDFSGLPQVQWSNRESACALLRQWGVEDPMGSIERLELPACHAAWKGGFHYFILFRLKALEPSRWRVECRIYNVKSRVVIASFWEEGDEINQMVGKLRLKTQEWIRKSG